MARSSRSRDIHPISVRELEVLRIEDVTPGMRRVILGGPGLRRHIRDGCEMPDFTSDGFDDDVRIIFPDPVTGSRPYPPPLGDGRLRWNEEVNRLFRTYTVRRFDPDAGEFTVDFARHGRGLAEGWALSVVPGAKVWVAGPKRCGALPVHTDHLILAGDETALPAIGRCLEELPAGTRATALVEVAERCDVQRIATCADVDLRWIVRAEGGDLVEDFGNLEWPGGRVYVWCAGEAGRLRGLRRTIGGWGVDPADRELTGYWREQGDGDGGGGAAPLHALARLADMSGGLALRAAVRAGVFTAVADGADTPGELAAATGMDGTVVVRFLRYLESCGLLRLLTMDRGEGPEVNRIRLTATGRELSDPESGTVRALAGPGLVKLAAFLNLDTALRSGGAVDLGGGEWSGGVDVGDLASRVIRRQQVSTASRTAPAVIETLGSGGGDGHRPVIGFVGAAAGTYADECARRRPELPVICLTSGTGAEGSATGGVLHRGYRPGECVEGVDVLVVIDPFALASPDGVTDLIRGCGVRELVLVTPQVEESAGEADDYEADLIRLCVSGASVPTAGDVRTVLDDAGYDRGRVEGVGWGFWRIAATRRS
ncbi:siderophore-interacting protein [Corynebacterium sp. P7003]|uniref:Siderophore-interacting protein n=1 Tax=Corynebacterium pygosceleis TaxID=2800406 RepID=A0ABT3WVE1_9CORY|nr:siderophore-interacting protein [Corynebacterium pygosceleis]MCX7444949.1 siderophore-interacting protein [Corynebacterium pygosceleis]